MGEAYTAMADDSKSLYWNPAGMAQNDQSEASFMYQRWFEGLTYNHLGVATPLEFGGLGASVSMLSYGDIQGYDDNDRPTGNVEAGSMVGTLGGAWLVGDASVGANLKLIREKLADVQTTGIAGDIGASYVIPTEVMGGTLRAAATLRNFGTGMKYLQERDPFPQEMRIGLAGLQMMGKKLNLSVDVAKARDNKLGVYSGLEVTPIRFMALRAGYAGTHDQSQGLRMGIGLRIKTLSFDYSYSNFEELGMTHRYEASWKFGAIRPLLTPEERKLLRQGKSALLRKDYAKAVLLFDALMKSEPRYKPTYTLIKRAMTGDEIVEKMARVRVDDVTRLLQGSKAVPKDFDDAAELEQLLLVGDAAMDKHVAQKK